MVRIGARSSRSRVARGGKTMALFRRNKTWWTDFSVNGQRFRMSLDTTDWRDSLKEEKKLIVQAQTGSSLPQGSRSRGSLSLRPPSATSIAAN
jgi:hypothetical protein